MAKAKPFSPEEWVMARVAKGWSLDAIERTAAFLAGSGLREDEWESYEAEVEGLVAVALDAYFDGLREEVAREAAARKSPSETSGSCLPG